MTRKALALLAVSLITAASVVAGPGAATAIAAGETLRGSGSSWSANAMNQWTADEAPKGVEIAFTSSSSGAGRQQFAEAQGDFANSDIPYQGADPLTGQADNSPNRSFAYMPIIAGGTALMYHLRQGKDLIRNVRLSGETLAKIFTGRVTNWSDPAITADMNGHALPARKIQVVVASGGSGTTAQFTDWLAKQFPDLWRGYAGDAKSTSYYPVKAPNVTAQGNDATIASTIASDGYDGAIGYVQYSYALNSHFPVAKIRNGKGYYSAPTPYNVAVALTQARIDLEHKDDPTRYLTQDLSQVYGYADPRTYPLSSYSYMIIPTDQHDRLITDGKAKTFADFSYYFLCEGQQEAPLLGYSPLPLNLVRAGFDQVRRFSMMKPEYLKDRDPRTCNNPTFDPNNPNANKLAEIDPAPPDCDMQGKGPCQTDNTADPVRGGSGGTDSGGGQGGDASTAGTNGQQGGPGAAKVDPETGKILGGDKAKQAGESSAMASASELAAFRSGAMADVMGVLAAIEVVLVLLVPAFVGRAISRRRAKNNGGG